MDETTTMKPRARSLRIEFNYHFGTLPILPCTLGSIILDCQLPNAVLDSCTANYWSDGSSNTGTYTKKKKKVGKLVVLASMGGSSEVRDFSTATVDCCCPIHMNVIREEVLKLQ